MTEDQKTYAKVVGCAALAFACVVSAVISANMSASKAERNNAEAQAAYIARNKCHVTSVTFDLNHHPHETYACETFNQNH